MTLTVVDLPHALSEWSRHHLSASALLTNAEELIRAGAPTEDSVWHDYLDQTSKPPFLRALPDAAARERWAESAFAAIRRSSYSLRTMLERRVSSHPDRILFEDRREVDSPSWSYAAVAAYTRAIAGLFLGCFGTPRVAIFSENEIDSACTDLACLTQGIFVTPLNVHTDPETLASIFRRLAINIVVTDSDERQNRATAAAARAGCSVVLFRTGTATDDDGARSLRQAAAGVDLKEASAILASREIDLLSAATVMFTSGSSGQSKGLVFSNLMLVTKRFARAAALPAVGLNETLLCYLPLFHTFGRYLEMLGTIFWGGTYVFAGNPSAEALIAEMGRVRPTGLISVPVRWTQIREQCLDSLERGVSEGRRFRELVGDRLRWGLSAAGYLDPKVFRFFHRHGVDLCSGFGMTEATGGITMTPPGSYIDGTVGLPLPGMKTRLTEEEELQISGVYVARYLDPDAETLPRIDPDEDFWVSTGDLFARDPNGYFSIVDRIKDIYKNSRGQTVAPQRVEQRFEGVPGIRRTFLAGDHRDHNVLLIVPDHDDSVISGQSAEEAGAYFGQIVASVNRDLAPYERVVNFATLDRDFSVEHDELTAKGSFRRKTIERNFATVIEKLYRRNHVELLCSGFTGRIPRWFFRDLGILESDIAVDRHELVNLRSGSRLHIAKAEPRVLVGDLEYELSGSLIDLGMFARQPRLWLGNEALVRFAPCKSGWDVALRNVTEAVRKPRRAARIRNAAGPSSVDERLRRIHELSVRAVFGDRETSLESAEQLGAELSGVDARTASLIRRRLEALAFRSEECIRALAYRILLLDVSVVGYDSSFPAFLESGLSFLTEESIALIAAARRGERRLQALRQRLYSYRTRMEWPAPPVRRRQFLGVLRLLGDFARQHPDDFSAVRAELAAWSLFSKDPALARAARKQLDSLTAWHQRTVETSAAKLRLDGAVVFDFGIRPDARLALERILSDDSFLAESIRAAFGDSFDWSRVPREGVWVSPMLSHHELGLYRLGINLSDGRHFDLLLVVGRFLSKDAVRDSILWLTALSGHAIGTAVLPRFGTWRKELGVASLAYVSDLTAWDRIRELSSQHDVRDGVAARRAWRKLYVRAMSAFFHGWEQSGYRIVPGAVTPMNVAIPDADFHEGLTILSIAGWREYEGPLSLIRPMVRNFYRMTGTHYPRSREILRLSWIFDAATEALGAARSAEFFDDLEAALTSKGGEDSLQILGSLDEYRQELKRRPHIPLPVSCAVERFGDWARMNPTATSEAREETVMQMIHLYRLHRYPDAFRYHVYEQTYFATSGEEVRRAFERLVTRRLADGSAPAVYLDELSELQSLLQDPEERAVFSRMIFPRSHRSQNLELLALGSAAERKVVVRSDITDDSGSRYVVREPLSAAEVGHLYRLILDTDYPMHFTEHDRQLMVFDEEERVVGGLCYRQQEAGVVYVDGIVVAAPLTNQGLGGKLLEDFCIRAAADGARLVKTNFFLGGLFTKHGFQVNQRWGGLVRFLEEG
jgi:long-chain acyl-CoA synthetase